MRGEILAPPTRAARGREALYIHVYITQNGRPTFVERSLCEIARSLVQRKSTHGRVQRTYSFGARKRGTLIVDGVDAERFHARHIFHISRRWTATAPVYL